MTLPNKLTMLRILLIPVMVIVWYIEPLHQNFVPYTNWQDGYSGVSWCMMIEFLIFAAASFTDFLDGSIARKRNLITSFGKFADPLADKMLVFTAMVLLMTNNAGDFWKQNIPAYTFIIMIIREFMVSGIRMVVASEGTVIAAAKLGKWKTATTMVALIVLFFSGTCMPVEIIGRLLMFAACILTVVSGIEYFWNSKHVILKSI
ncbi:MAG: CDP-diacylglycerol--glycerol-3-phosphate 3-phosphatidyltransferase [Acholeplasmatales bacterium]|nr:CDP-diacylglycerol--glycerol-3-phosphate 3-phosphatidyltransferase [Acholeplasmatales bacterium]